MKYSERLADERDEPCALSGGQTKTRIGALVPLLADSELGTDAAQGLRATCFLFTPLFLCLFIIIIIIIIILFFSALFG